MANTVIELKDDFEVIEEGHKYALPVYEVNEDGIKLTGDKQLVHFVRGSKDLDSPHKRRNGTLHEHLICMMIADLQHKNNQVPSRETSMMITCLQEAHHWAIQRQVDRQKREVQGTYKK